MGLGKTLQAISFLSYLKVHQKSPGPFCESRKLIVLIYQKLNSFKQISPVPCTFYTILLCFHPYFFLSTVVLCPLSVTDGWVSEVANFAPKLRVLRYVGDKEHRRSLRRIIYEHVKEQSSNSDVSYGSY